MFPSNDYSATATNRHNTMVLVPVTPERRRAMGDAPESFQRSTFTIYLHLRRWRRGSRRSRRCVRSAVTAAGVHDDAGALPGLDKAFAGFSAVALPREVVHVAHRFDERGGVGFHFSPSDAEKGGAAERESDVWRDQVLAAGPSACASPP
jgi:hypothetical protein